MKAYARCCLTLIPLANLVPAQDKTAPAAQTAPATQRAPAAEWAAWRGSMGTGSSPTGNPPAEWSETKNIRWKVAIPGRGISSPIVWGDRIYLTSAVATDRQAPAQGELEPQSQLAQPRPTVIHEFRVVAVNRRDGSVIWNRKVAEAVPHEGGHSTNSFASNSPVTDGMHIFANFGSRGLYCLDPAGSVVWSKSLGVMRTRRQYGEASSPALFGDRLIVNWDHEGDSFLVVFDKRTGEELWRQPRDEVTSWSTPIVVPVDGHPQIIINATSASRGYDLATGKVIWSLPGMTVNCIPHPIAAEGVVYLMSGYRGDKVQAVKLSGAKGDLTDSAHLLWSHHRSASYVPSAVLYGGYLYFLRKNNAVLTCLDAKTGAIHYEGQKLRGLRSIYASPVAVAGRIYITSREGVTRVIKHGKAFAEIATNRLDDAVDASLALVGDEIYLRSHRYLYCIAQTAGDKPPAKKVAAESAPFRYVRSGSLGSTKDRTASLSVGDVDGDGDLDLVVANGRHWPGQNRLFRNDGKGGFPKGENLSAEQSTTYAVPLADLDGDGDLDAVVGNDRAPSYVLWNDGKGVFVKGPRVGRISNTRSVTLADLDGENGIDVILTNRGEANLVCFNDGKRGFDRVKTFGGKTDATINVAAGDLDEDGDLDLAVANRNGQQNQIYFNDGKGGFAKTRGYGTGSDQTRGVALADVDGDGHLDILNANIGEPNAVYFGDGKGGFGRGITLGGKAGSFALTTADVNGDGRLDVIVGNVAAANAIYVQRADRTFARIEFGGPDGVTYGVVAADWNGDGRPEIATANSNGKNYLYQIAGWQLSPPSPAARNRRGDVLLKEGRFAAAIADFDAYIASQPSAEPYHWQRGIAYYYAGRYEDGVRQFVLHKSVNPNDVENAAWHFLCKARLDGVAAARAALLPVGKDPRVPMQAIYEMFAGRATVAHVEAAAQAARGAQAESALFYAHLYIGLYHEALGNTKAARRHIEVAAKTHPSTHYMGDVARMHARRLAR